MLDSYEPSGKFDSTVFLFALLGAGLAVGLGWLYQLIVAWIPFIYLNFIATLAFAGALWGAMYVSVDWGHCRNRIVAVGVGVAIGLVGIAASHYFAYQAFVDAMLADVERLGLRPGGIAQLDFWKYVEIRVEAGYSISRGASSSGDGMPLSGIFVYGVWAVEAAIVVAGGIWGGWEAASRPFCESCGEWQHEDDTYLYPTPAFDVVQQLEDARTVEELVAPDIAFADATSRSLVYYTGTCPSCDDSNFLTVNIKDVTQTSKGEEVKESSLWENLEVGPEAVEKVSELPGRIADRSRELREKAEAEDGESNAGDATPERPSEEPTEPGNTGGGGTDDGKETPW